MKGILLRMSPAIFAALVYVLTDVGLFDGGLILVFLIAIGCLIWTNRYLEQRDTKQHIPHVWHGYTCRYGGPATVACWHPGACGCHIIPLDDENQED